MRTYLRDLRASVGLTQNEVADKLGIGASTYTMIELGERQKNMSVAMVQKLSEVFCVPVIEFLEKEQQYQKINKE